MGKNKDLVTILLIVIVGMFIPFLLSVSINYGFFFNDLDSWLKIFSTFGWFLVFFALELFAVFLYFSFTNKIAEKKLKQYKNK